MVDTFDRRTCCLGRKTGPVWNADLFVDWSSGFLIEVLGNQIDGFGSGLSLMKRNGFLVDWSSLVVDCVVVSVVQMMGDKNPFANVRVDSIGPW